MRRNERMDEADRMRLAGHNAAQIAAEMGVRRVTVYAYLSEAERQRNGVKIDRRHKALSELPMHVQRWLAEITPKGATISDTVRAIITDAYFEDKKDIDAPSGSV